MVELKQRHCRMIVPESKMKTIPAVKSSIILLVSSVFICILYTIYILFVFLSSMYKKESVLEVLFNCFTYYKGPATNAVFRFNECI